MGKIIKGFIFVFAFALFISPVLAKDNHDEKENNGRLNLNWQREVNPNMCSRVGEPVVNVVQKVKNDADSGENGNYWAFDNYNRHITMWHSDANDPTKFCAIVRYEGEFEAVAGQTSPGQPPTEIGKDVAGEMKGGYRATLTGTLLASPLWPTYGSVGTTDYNCDILGNCPGRISWPGRYFETGLTFDYDWWGWIYRAKEGHGTWVNAVSGNTGNIF